MKMIVYDLSLVAGVSCVAYAGSYLSPALAWCAAGVALTYYGVAGALQARKGGRK
jgi:hypothetical protein